MVSQGRSYNIRMDDEVLVRFSPKNPTSTYFFGDMVRARMNQHVICEPHHAQVPFKLFCHLCPSLALSHLKLCT